MTAANSHDSRGVSAPRGHVSSLDVIAREAGCRRAAGLSSKRSLYGQPPTPGVYVTAWLLAQ
jgi:hypothetical protein